MPAFFSTGWTICSTVASPSLESHHSGPLTDKVETQQEEALKKDYAEIFQNAAPYLNTRRNDVHIQISYEFALRLLSFYPEADEHIVLPAIILHDVGWKIIPEDEHLISFGPNMKDKNNQRRHEVEGAKIADEILSSLGFDRELIEGISDIIDGHDSRLIAINLNDQIVKDADKLWRFTPIGFEIDRERFGVEKNDHFNFLNHIIDQWMFTPEAREMARKELGEVKKQSGI